MGTTRGKKHKNYYLSLAKNRADRLELERAGKVGGLGDEIAVMRTLMKKALAAEEREKKAQRDLKTASTGLDVLMRALSTESRVARRSGSELAANVETVLEQLGDLILPPTG